MTPLIFLFGASFLPYFWLNRRPARYYWESKFDKRIPLIPLFVLPYISLLPLICTSLYFLRGRELTVFLTAYLLANLSASLFWYLFPNGVRRPKVNTRSIFSKALGLLYANDQDTNGCPSGHVYGAVICTYFLTRIFLGDIFVLTAITLWGLLIILSTLFVKQHYIIDVFVGILWAVLTILTTQEVGLRGYF